MPVGGWARLGRSLIHMKKKKKPAAKKRVSRGILIVPPHILRRELRAQAEGDRQKKLRKRAAKIRELFKPSKRDRGRYVAVNAAGKRARGRNRGTLLYVTTTGKKQLINQTGRGGWQLRLQTDMVPPLRLRKAEKMFVKNRLARAGNFNRAPVVRKRGSVKGGGPRFDFSQNVVDAVARSVRTALLNQRSRRSFLIRVVGSLVGRDETFRFDVSIARRDHDAIRVGGIENWVRQRFYKFLAHELARQGFVTVGSMNHTRMLAVNRGADRDEWTTGEGQEWSGSELEDVQIERLQWEILQQDYE